MKRLGILLSSTFPVEGRYIKQNAKQIQRRIFMQNLHVTGLDRLLNPKKDTKSATERILTNLGTSNYGLHKNENTTPSVMDSFDLAENISELLSPACGMTDEEKQRYLAHILAKLKSGKKLTAEEMRFLQAEEPQLYQQAARIQTMRDALENRLKNCKSKEEAAKIFTEAMSSVSDKDPMKEFIYAAYEDVYREYQESGGQNTESDEQEKSAP